MAAYGNNVPNEFKNFDLTNQNDVYYLFSHYYGNPQYEDFFNWYLNTYVGATYFRNWSSIAEAYNTANQTGDWNKALGDLATQGTELDPTAEKFVDNKIAQQNTTQAQNYETQMRDTSLLSSGEQLQQLGLSPSNVISVGGMSTNGVGAAANSMHSAAIPKSQLRQQALINKYNNQMGLAKTLISTAGSMASSGIYGAALGAVKHSAAAVAGATAHSGLNALRVMKETKASPGWSQRWDDMVSQLGK